MQTLFRRALLLFAALSLVSAFFSAAANAAAHEETTSRSFTAPKETRFLLENLAGEIVIERSAGDTLELAARTVAEAGSEKEAASLARSVKLDIDESGRQIAVRTMYPLDDHEIYIYRPEGAGRFSHHTRYHDRKILVTSEERRGGVHVHTDFVLKVPDGARVKVENVAGRIEAADLNADLFLGTGAGAVDVSGVTGKLLLDTGSAPVSVREHRGDVMADTGSGSVLIEDLAGNASADTGSGSVSLRRVEGDVHADTGSGSVKIEEVTAGRIHADTGSGSVSLREATGSLHADTGSGSVQAEDFFAGESVEVDTGSGSVALEGNLAEVRRLRIDTGSGSVRIRTAQLPSLHLETSAGSGRVEVDLPALSGVRSGRRYFEGDVGDGDGEAVIDTGSGSISLRMQ
ncbi:MAG: DUF4097 family beta strand repeat protein [Gammaproteobacteria bacterium]|nr:DUF4097 family beta strand repeat protein [Gammaproteobacteria bacterium]